MKKKLLLLSLSALIALNASPVFAEDSKEVTELKSQIEMKEKELNELKAKLKELSGNKEESGNAYTIEGRKGKYTFSNPRTDGKVVLVDLDFEETSGEAQTLWTSIPFELQFEQEDDSSVYDAKVNYLYKGDVGERKAVTMDTKVKAGGKVQLTLVIEIQSNQMPLFIRTNGLNSNKQEIRYDFN